MTNEDVLKTLDYQSSVLGNVAAGMLARQYRLNGAWNEAQEYQVQRIMREMEAAKRRAAAIFEEHDKVAKAGRVLNAEQEKMDRIARMRNRMKVQKSLRMGKA